MFNTIYYAVQRYLFINPVGKIMGLLFIGLTIFAIYKFFAEDYFTPLDVDKTQSITIPKYKNEQSPDYIQRVDY